MFVPFLVINNFVFLFFCFYTWKLDFVKFSNSWFCIHFWDCYIRTSANIGKLRLIYQNGNYFFRKAPTVVLGLRRLVSVRRLVCNWDVLRLAASLDVSLNDKVAGPKGRQTLSAWEVGAPGELEDSPSRCLSLVPFCSRGIRASSLSSGPPVAQTRWPRFS